jgi:hypothetical protein
MLKKKNILFIIKLPFQNNTPPIHIIHIYLKFHCGKIL